MYTNPFGITGMATLFQDRALIEFQGLNPYVVESNALKASLEGQRYLVGSYKDFDGGDAHGTTICQSSASTYETDARTFFGEGKKYATVIVID